MGVPKGAISRDNVNLLTTEQNLVTGITKVIATGSSIKYLFSVVAVTEGVGQQTRTVTFTFTIQAPHML
jgi:hypothetical protein